MYQLWTSKKKYRKYHEKVRKDSYLSAVGSCLLILQETFSKMSSGEGIEEVFEV